MPSIGVNLRVTGHCSQGGRKYMEDFFSVAYQQTEFEDDLEYAYIGIFDGHGGEEAAVFAKDHLLGQIVRQKNFWSDNDDDVMKAIRDGFISTHFAMWKEQAKWPKSLFGLPSTAGTTATIAFIRRAKIYIGHVGDSGVVLGYEDEPGAGWKAHPLTKDHKPESPEEMARIHRSGGKVIYKSGVPRVVWNRPRIGHAGPVRRSTPIDEVPFLAVARSLGDLWSYNSNLNEFVVSPDPDTCVIPIDTTTFRCLIFGTDGLWNMVDAQKAVRVVETTEFHNEHRIFNETETEWINPSRKLVDASLERWQSTKWRADNTTAVTLLLDPPGPPKTVVLMNRAADGGENVIVKTNEVDSTTLPTLAEPYPANGLAIVTRFVNEDHQYASSSSSSTNLNQTINKSTEKPDVDVNAGQTDVNTVIETVKATVENKNTESVMVIEAVTPPRRPNNLSNIAVTTTKPDSSIQINEVSSSSPEIPSENSSFHFADADKTTPMKKPQTRSQTSVEPTSGGLKKSTRKLPNDCEKSTMSTRSKSVYDKKTLRNRAIATVDTTPVTSRKKIAEKKKEVTIKNQRINDDESAVKQKEAKSAKDFAVRCTRSSESKAKLSDFRCKRFDRERMLSDDECYKSSVEKTHKSHNIDLADRTQRKRPRSSSEHMKGATEKMQLRSGWGVEASTSETVDVAGNKKLRKALATVSSTDSQTVPALSSSTLKHAFSSTHNLRTRTISSSSNCDEDQENQKSNVINRIPTKSLVVSSDAHKNALTGSSDSVRNLRKRVGDQVASVTASNVTTARNTSFKAKTRFSATLDQEASSSTGNRSAACRKMDLDRNKSGKKTLVNQRLESRTMSTRLRLLDKCSRRRTRSMVNPKINRM